MRLIAPQVRVRDSGERCLVFRLPGGARVAAGPAALLAIATVCVSFAVAAPLVAWTIGVAEPFFDFPSLLLDHLRGTLFVAAILALPVAMVISLGVVASRMGVDPEPEPDAWAWAVNARVRIALAATVALPVPALAVAWLMLVGLGTKPGLFTDGAAPLPRWLAFCGPASHLAALLLPVIWHHARAAALRRFRACCAEAGAACPGCGYPRRGLPAPICPECGGTLAPARCSQAASAGAAPTA